MHHHVLGKSEGNLFQVQRRSLVSKFQDTQSVSALELDDWVAALVADLVAFWMALGFWTADELRRSRLWRVLVVL